MNDIERKYYSQIVTDLSSDEAVIIAVSQYEYNQKTPLIVCTARREVIIEKILRPVI